MNKICICWNKNYFYFVAVDGVRSLNQVVSKVLMGEKRSSGMKIIELAEFMKDQLRCECGLEMDGGKSSTLYYKKRIVNSPATGVELPINGPLLIRPAPVYSF